MTDGVEARFAPFAEKMRRERLPELAIETFRHYYAQLIEGATGFVGEDEIAPAADLPLLADLASYADAGRRALGTAVVIKLNGGLATSMGMTRAKSLLEVKRGHSFLDVIAGQVKQLRAATSSALPLVLMNSFRTRDDSLEALARHELDVPGLPLDFLQHKVPRIASDSLEPVSWPRAPEHEWCPPGHGDIFTALATSGALAALRERGIRYAFVSNADNLGASLDPSILGWVAQERVPFAMEVTERTAADRKGGHLAMRRSDGRLVLREAAQCPPSEQASFQDIERHRYFNTNNLWVDLDALARALGERGAILGLPLIRNEKRVDPLDASSPAAIQLETAMGAAIGVFAGARALCVPRARFAPVKATSDLLAVRSDAYELGSDWQVVRSPAASPALAIDLDPAGFQRIDQFELRFPRGAPSLVGCRSLRVRGDVRFGANVVCRGDVSVEAADGERLSIPDGAVLGGEASRASRSR